MATKDDKALELATRRVLHGLHAPTQSAMYRLDHGTIDSTMKMNPPPESKPALTIASKTYGRQPDLPAHERKALVMAISEIVEKYGSERRAQEHIGISQQSINRILRHGTPGASVARKILRYLRTDIDSLVEKYGIEPENELVTHLLAPCAVVREIAEKNGYLAETVSQLELYVRVHPDLPEADIERIGDGYDAVNIQAARRTKQK